MKKRFSESAQIWKFLTEKDAANVVYQEGYVQTLAESGDHRLAIKKMDSLLKQHPDNRHYLMAAYVYRLAGRHEEELFMTTLAMNTRSAKKEDVGLYHRALKDNQLASVALNDNTSGTDPEHVRIMRRNWFAWRLPRAAASRSAMKLPIALSRPMRRC